MPDEEEEGVVGDESGWNPGAAQHHDSSGGSGSLRSLLVDLHESLVHDFGQHQVIGRRHACHKTKQNNIFDLCGIWR